MTGRVQTGGAAPRGHSSQEFVPALREVGAWALPLRWAGRNASLTKHKLTIFYLTCPFITLKSKRQPEKCYLLTGLH